MKFYYRHDHWSNHLEALDTSELVTLATDATTGQSYSCSQHEHNVLAVLVDLLELSVDTE